MQTTEEKHWFQMIDIAICKGFQKWLLDVEQAILITYY